MKRFQVTSLVLIFLAALSACSKLTAENYARIRIGMAYPEVTDILGKPNRCSDIAGFKSCQWGSDQRGISVRFVGEKVVLHTAENIQ